MERLLTKHGDVITQCITAVPGMWDNICRRPLHDGIKVTVLLTSQMQAKNNPVSVWPYTTVKEILTHR
jgi:hypothetical protein